jgi:hypothetical protein
MQNFGQIKEAFNEILSENITNKKNKDLFKKYIKMLKEDKMLKTQFLVVTNIENKIESDREKATQFVKENIELFSSFDKNKLLESNKKLFSLLEGHSYNQGFGFDITKLHADIATLIFTKRTPNNIDTIVETTGKIVDYIVNNKPKVITESIELPTSMISTIMVEKYNDKYADLTEDEKKVIRVLLNSNDEDKKELYTTTVKECIELVNEQLKNCSLDTKEKLLVVKERLLNDKQLIDENYTKNINKLINLKNDLK